MSSTDVKKPSPNSVDSPAGTEVTEWSQIEVDVSPETGTNEKANVKDKNVYDFNRDCAIRKIYENSSCTDNIVRKLFPYEWAVNMKDCFDFCIPNTVRSADQITDILVFVNFQSSRHLVVKMLSITLFILTWICSGIRWFVSLREMDIKASKGRPLQRTFLFIYIVPILGIPMHFVYDIYMSSIKPMFRPRFLQTMRNPAKELAELEFNAFLELFAESAVSSIIGVILFVYQTIYEDDNIDDDKKFQDGFLLAVSVCISIYNVIKSVIIVRKQSAKHGYDMLEYVFIRIQFAEVKTKQFLPFLGKLESGKAKDVNIAATELVDSDIAVLEGCIAPASGEILAKGLKRFQLSVLSLGRLSLSAAYRLGSIFRNTDIQIFVAKVATMADVRALYADYCESNLEPMYEHDFADRIILQTTGCVGEAVLRCEDTLPYISEDLEKHDENLQIRFGLFLRGLFGFEENDKLDHQENLVSALEQRNWRAMEFLMGKNGNIDPTFPFPQPGKSLLGEAVSKGDVEMVRFLHYLGADINADFPTQSGAVGSLFHIAAENGDKKMLESLQNDYQMDINRLNSLKRTPLFHCRKLETYNFMMTLGARESDVVDQTQDSLPHDNLIPSNVDEMDEIAEIYSRILVGLRVSGQHIVPIIMTIASYCVPVIANNPDDATSFNLKFFRRCRSWIPYEFKSLVDLKIAVNLWCENENKAHDEYGHISNWITSAVKDMSNLFSDKKNFDDDISQWDVSSVTNMGRMFYQASSFNGDLTQWDVSSVKEMDRMFYQASSFNGDLTQWDVSSVRYMSAMFYKASSFNGDLSQWDVSAVKSKHHMFSGASSFDRKHRLRSEVEPGVLDWAIYGGDLFLFFISNVFVAIVLHMRSNTCFHVTFFIKNVAFPISFLVKMLYN